MFCKHCGTQNEDGAAFCSNCGKPLNDETPVQPQQPVQPTQTIIIQQTVQQPAEPAEPAPTGFKKIMYLVGAICSFVAIVLLFGLFFGSGTCIKVAGVEMSSLTTIDFFSPAGFWKGLIEALSSGRDGLSSAIGNLFSAILAFVGIITLLVYFIIGIVKFVKAMKGTDYHGVNKTAIKMYCTFASIELLMLSFKVGTGIALNAAALAAFCLGAILIGANIVFHFVGNLKENFGLKKLLRFGANLLVLVVGVIIAALAAGPVLKLDGESGNFFQQFLPSILQGGSTGRAAAYVYTALGWFSTIVLISLGVSLIQLMFLKTLDHVNGKENQKSGLGYTIASFIFGLILVVVTYLYGKEVHATVNGALPIVIMVFSFLASAGIIVRNKLLGK